MNWLLPALFIALTGSLILVFTYASLYSQERQKYIALWLTAWLLYAIRCIFEVLAVEWENQAILLVVNQLSLLWSAAFLLWGTCLFSGKRLNRLWLALFTGGSIWIIAGLSFHLPYPWTTVPTFLTSAFTNVFTGVTLLRFREARGPAKLTTGWVFILWGLHKADYPLLRQLPWVASFGYLLSAIFSLVSAVGIILVYLEKTKRELRESEQKYRSIFENAVDGIFQTSPEGRLLSANPVPGADLRIRIPGVHGRVRIGYDDANARQPRRPGKGAGHFSGSMVPSSSLRPQYTEETERYAGFP